VEAITIRPCLDMEKGWVVKDIHFVDLFLENQRLAIELKFFAVKLKVR
jgi:imidazole glycerol phosphate synthase subunit HisF